MTAAPVYKTKTPRTDSIWNANSDTEGTPTNIMKIYDEMRMMEFEIAYLKALLKDLKLPDQ
ncbi:MAG: hypothetical protein K9G65_06315 [Rickettsiaceae bacterium]|jgi:hypothetical protein|nr:hypothetical protein [Rickettsiaceae bacterium]